MITIIQNLNKLSHMDYPEHYRKMKFPIAVYEFGEKRFVQENINHFDILEGLTFNRKKYITV